MIACNQIIIIKERYSYGSLLELGIKLQGGEGLPL